MQAFRYTGLPARVTFGAGAVNSLSDEIQALGLSRVMVLTTPPQADLGQSILEKIGPQGAGLFTGAAMHTPVSVTDEALKAYQQSGAEGLVSVGGGSTIGLGKAIALRNDASQIVLPTTYAGSEMTPIIGQTEHGQKTTQRTLKVLPESVIYDVDFTLTLPAIMSVTSGMNALAHAVEALYAESSNPVLSLMAEEGVAALVRALPVISETPGDEEARTDALYGAWLCAVCLGSGGVALHHKLCHVLGGSFDLPHAETHTIMLPHALAYNAPAVPDAMQRLRRATGSETPARRLFNIAKTAGAPVALRDIGMPEGGIDRAVEATLENPYYNPRPLEADGIRGIIKAAWAGELPAC